MSSFGLYLIGFVLVILGLIYLAMMWHVSQTYIAVGAVILLGIGILTGVTRTRRRDPSDTE